MAPSTPSSPPSPANEPRALPAEPLIRVVFRYLLTIGMVFAGISHFTSTKLFLAMVPPALPAPLLLVYVSGVAEIAGGIGLQIPALRRLASFGLIALYIAVFPANIYMAVAHVQLGDLPTPPWAMWARLPLQALFIAWAYWVGRAPARSSKST